MTRDVQQEIRDTIQTHRIVLYMKGTPQFPMCGFSAAVVDVLNQLGVRYHAVDVLEDPEIRQGIKDFSRWPTIPQLYVDGEFIGGADITQELFQTGKLHELLGVRRN